MRLGASEKVLLNVSLVTAWQKDEKFCTQGYGTCRLVTWLFSAAGKPKLAKSDPVLCGTLAK